MTIKSRDFPELSKLKIKLGKPKHGWVPISLKLNSFTLKIDASNVANDPIFELIDCINFIKNGISGFRRVCFWLEPFTYILDICKNSNSGNISVYIRSKGDEYPPVTDGKMKEEYRCFIRKNTVDIARIIIDEINRWIAEEAETINEFWSNRSNLYKKYTKQIKL